MIRFLLLSLAAAAATPAVAQSQQSTAVGIARPATGDGDKLVCHRETETGSNFPKKVCHTKAEWAAINDAHSNDVDKMSRARNNTARPGN